MATLFDAREKQNQQRKLQPKPQTNFTSFILHKVDFFLTFISYQWKKKKPNLIVVIV